jgi:hypothetical protein
MKKKMLVVLSLMSCVSLISGPSPAADQDQDKERAQNQEKSREMTQTQEPIYGSQLMTEQERLEYRARLREAPTEEDRNQIRGEHHELMQERAKAQGMVLPEQPPEGRGMGQGGMGGGRGGGMGGGGRGR